MFKCQSYFFVEKNNKKKKIKKENFNRCELENIFSEILTADIAKLEKYLLSEEGEYALIEKRFLLEKENGLYMVTLYEENDECEDAEVRSMTNYDATEGGTQIFGEYWSNAFLLEKKDENLIKKVVFEFFDKGQVSYDLMD